MSPPPLPRTPTQLGGCTASWGQWHCPQLPGHAWVGPDLNSPPQHSPSWVTAVWGVLFLFVNTFLTFPFLPGLRARLGTAVG